MTAHKPAIVIVMLLTIIAISLPIRAWRKQSQRGYPIYHRGKKRH
jgi:hypothetical protein